MFKLSHLWAIGLFILPFFSISGIPFPYIYPKVFLLQAYAALGLCLIIFENKKEELTLGPIFFSVLGLFLVSLASSFYAEDLVAAFFGPFWRGTGVFFYFTCLIIWLNLKNCQYPKEKLGKLIVYSGLLVSCFTLFYRMVGQVGISNTTLMGNPNALSCWIGVSLFLNFHFRESLDKNKFLYYGTYLISSLAVVLLGSRSTLGGIIIGSLLIGLFSNRKFLKASLAGLGTILLGVGLQHLIAKQSLILDIIERTKKFHRKEIWLGAWDSFMAHPFLGYGFHGLIQGYWENFPSKISQEISWNDNAHSLLLNILGEMGLFGFLLFALVCYFLGKRLFGFEKELRAFWIGLGFFLMSYALVQPFYIDTVILMILLAYLFGDKAKVQIPTNNKIGIGFQVPVILTLFILTYLQISQLSLINQTRLDIVSNKNYRKTWNQFMETPGLLDKPGALLEVSNQMGAAFNGNSKYLKSLRGPMTSFMIDQYSKNFESFSQRPRMYENYASWLTRAGKYQEAILVLDRSLERSDKITKSVYQKASIYVKMKDYKKAKLMLLRVKELNPLFPGVDGYLMKLKNF